MSSDHSITKENLDTYLRELAREFRRLNGTKMPAEIILVGGAAILTNYGFRDMTYDIDAVILASSAMHEAINRVGDKYGLPNGWINTDFTRTVSYSSKLREISSYYKTFSNIVQIRTISAEYLIAMKLMSGRRYKNDLSDIVGILWEHQQRGTSIERGAIDRAVVELYGESALITTSSATLLDEAFSIDNYETLFQNTRESEQHARQILLDYEHDQGERLTENDIEDILHRARSKLGVMKDSSVCDTPQEEHSINNGTRKSRRKNKDK